LASQVQYEAFDRVIPRERRTATSSYQSSIQYHLAIAGPEIRTGDSERLAFLK
jgi:hypothetical protein